MTYSKFFEVAGLTIEVNSELKFEENTFADKFDLFLSKDQKAGKDNIVLNHYFERFEKLQIFQILSFP